MADKELKSLNFGGEDTYFPLPIVTSEDNDKILMVVDGKWVAGDVPVQSGAYVWEKHHMSSTITETAEEGRYYLAKTNSYIQSAELEYGTIAPVYDATQKTWIMPNSTIGTLAGSGSSGSTNLPGIENATYYRFTNQPNIWYLVEGYYLQENEISGNTIYLKYTMKYEASPESCGYVVDDDSAKYPEAGWQDNCYYDKIDLA